MTRMTLNGEAVRFRLDPATPLLWALRDAANLTGAKYGCDSGECGACTVLVDGQAVTSCTAAIGALEGAEVVTIEGLGDHPLKAAWAAEQVSQCGYCEPGMIMALGALLNISPRPSEAELANVANICRCGIGPRLVRAVVRAGRAAAPQVAKSGPVEDPSRFSNGSSIPPQSPRR